MVVEDLADKVDDLICVWDKVVDSDIETVVILLLGMPNIQIMTTYIGYVRKVDVISLEYVPNTRYCKLCTEDSIHI